MGAEKADEEQGEGRKDSCLTWKYVKVDPEKKNKLNLTATAVLMNGWEDSKGRHVFISQSW